MEDNPLVYFEIEKTRMSYLFRDKNDDAYECSVVDMFNNNIVVRYDVFLLKNPPYFAYVFVEFSKYEKDKVYRMRKEFFADRICDTKFNKILGRMMKVKTINEFREFYRDLIFRIL